MPRSTQQETEAPQPLFNAQGQRAPNRGIGGVLLQAEDGSEEAKELDTTEVICA